MVPWTLTYKSDLGEYKTAVVAAPSSLSGMTAERVSEISGLPTGSEVVSAIRGDHSSTAIVPPKSIDNEEIIIG